jgi:hypothetical protein
VSEEDKRAALANSEIVRAVEILYATDQRDLVVPIAADLAERGSDLALLAAIGEVMAQHEDTLHVVDREGVLGRVCVCSLRVPDFRAAAVHGNRGRRRACDHLFDRAPGECFHAKAVSSAHALGDE